jgi:LuxR family maltose regulon positive regulatory protein
VALFGEELVTRTKFVLPTPRRQHLLRPRLQALLAEAEDARLVLVQAPAGFGKSTLIAAHVRTEQQPTWWYELAERDADHQTFLIHLAHLSQRELPGSAQRALSLLAPPGGAGRHGEAVVEALADAWLEGVGHTTWLVLDDFQRAASAGVTDLVNHLIRALRTRQISPLVAGDLMAVMAATLASRRPPMLFVFTQMLSLAQNLVR